MGIDEVDLDLGEMNEETFAKDIQDARKMWHIILLPEK
jgi:hypothetical protein